MRNDAKQDTHRRDAERLATKIRTWCVRQGDDLGQIARRAGVSRTTLYQILRGRTRRPHVATLHRIAAALGISPDQLCDDQIGDAPAPPHRATVDDRSRQFDRRTNTLVAEIRAAQSHLFAGWTDQEWDELYSTFGTGGQLTPEGIVHTAGRINEKRETLQQLQIVLETHLADVAAEMIRTLFRMVRPPTSDETAENVREHSVRRRTELAVAELARVRAVNE